jgi:cell division GTPase FtsZ
MCECAYGTEPKTHVWDDVDEICVVTKPFSFEGAQRKQISERGLAELTDKVDTIITIPNDKILQVIEKKTSILDAFMVVDEVLRQGVQGISELITIPGLINVDFNDVKAVMSGAGSALMGIGQASGENKAIEAAKMAINSPLLEMSIEGARGILFTIVGGSNLSMHEVNEAAKIITSSADEDAKIIFGAVIDPKYKDEIKITVVATGFNGKRPVGTPSSIAPNIERSYSPTPFIEEDQERFEVFYLHALLSRAIPISYGYRMIGEGIEVDRDAVRSSNLILGVIAFADVPSIIPCNGHLFFEGVIDFFCFYYELFFV